MRDTAWASLYPVRTPPGHAPWPPPTSSQAVAPTPAPRPGLTLAPTGIPGRSELAPPPRRRGPTEPALGPFPLMFASSRTADLLPAAPHRMAWVPPSIHGIGIQVLGHPGAPCGAPALMRLKALISQMKGSAGLPSRKAGTPSPTPGFHRWWGAGSAGRARISQRLPREAPAKTALERAPQGEAGSGPCQ